MADLDRGEPAERATTPEDLTAAVLASFAETPDARLRHLLERLVDHLHAFVGETGLTPEEWAAGVEFLTRTGQACTDRRQEVILLSDTLGVSMLVDLLGHPGPPGATESTVLGPFYVPGAPLREMGSSTAAGSGYGEPARVSGRVVGPEGRPVAGAVLDVWQNATGGRYAVQDPDQPPENLRGRFRTAEDGRYRFWAVRPTDYPVPDDGPVGDLLAASKRHPWRPAHLHLIVTAPGFARLTTHLFDDESPYLESDAVFAVKPSLICHFERHEPGSEGAPAGYAGAWCSLERDLVLTPAPAPAPAAQRSASASPPAGEASAGP